MRKNRRVWKLGEAEDKVVGLREIRGRILAVARVWETARSHSYG
jgi:hypothetical protein